MLLRVVSWVRVVLAAPVVWVSPGDCMVVPGACPRFPWPGLGGLLAHRLWWFRCPPVAEVAGGDADGGVLPAMVCLMPLAWVM